nr:probable protein phosphatase 2C 62 [Ipomoea batatas]GMC85580.1 probable protein phosphatase 2C 62 [Ipomoea batatas]
MADLLSNSIPNFPLFNPPNTPPKLFHPFSALSRTSTAGIWSRRRRRKPPQIIFFCKPSSQDLAVISTHEHADGSLIFRFGDPSELAKEEELMESKPEKVGSEDVEEFSVVKVLDGDCEREVIVKNVERKKVRADATVTEVSDSVVSRSEGSSLLERGIESDDDCFGSSVHQTGLLDCSASEVSTKNDVPLDEIGLEKDGGRVTIELTDTVEVRAEQSDRELSEKSASEVCTTNVVALEEKDWGKASIPLTDNVEVQAEEFDRGSSGESASKVSTENVVPLEKDGGKESVPLIDNVEVQAEQGDKESNVKSAPELSTENVVPLEEIVVEKDDGEALISLTDNGSTSVEVPTDQGNRESSEISASLFSTENVVTQEEIVIEKDESEVSVPLTDHYTASLEVQAEQGGRESSEKLLEDSVAEVQDSYGSEVTKENAIPVDGKFSEEQDAESSVSLRDNGGASAQVQAAESGGESTIQSISSDVDSSMNVTVNYVDQESSEDDESFKHFSTDTVEQSSLKDSIEDSGENQIIHLSKEAEDSREDEVVELMPTSPPTEAEPILDEEVSQEIQELYDPDKTQMPLLLNNNSPNLLLEVAEQTEDVESSVPTEASGRGMVEVEYTVASITSKDIQTAQLVLSSGAALLPHPSKALTGGEDAYFVTNQNWLGIADGVVQWSLEGTYPGLYSRELMENCEKVILQSGSDSGTDPKVVLKLSVAKVESPGSSTVLIAHFDGQAFHVANIGDSGFLIIRNGVIYKKSSPMLHEFNFPMQIGSGDDPSQIVEEYRIELDEGDIVVTGTDGLFDNLYAQEIASIITKLLEANETPKEIAEILATRAQEVGGAASGRTPFSDAAQAAGYVGQTGGKLDDVAVIVSLVQNPTH